MTKKFTETQRENLAYVLGEVLEDWTEDGQCRFDPYDSDNLDALIDAIEKEIM